MLVFSGNEFEVNYPFLKRLEILSKAIKFTSAFKEIGTKRCIHSETKKSVPIKAYTPLICFNASRDPFQNIVPRQCFRFL